MYQAHFRLQGSPFSPTPDLRFLWLTPRQREDVEHLLQGVRRHPGLFVLSGESGVGKTLLARWIVSALTPDTDMVTLVPPFTTWQDLVMRIGQGIGTAFPDPRAGPDVASHLDACEAQLHRHLTERHEHGQRVVLLVDDAHQLSQSVLEQIGSLIRTTTLFLVGQPHLNDMLARPGLRTLLQRVAARYHLRFLERHETGEYIRYRLAVVGCANNLFDDAIVQRIHRASGGVPRVVNSICHQVLRRSFALGRDVIAMDVVEQTIGEIEGIGAPATLPGQLPIFPLASGRSPADIGTSGPAVPSMAQSGARSGPGLWQRSRGMVQSSLRMVVYGLILGTVAGAANFFFFQIEHRPGNRSIPEPPMITRAPEPEPVVTAVPASTASGPAQEPTAAPALPAASPTPASVTMAVAAPKSAVPEAQITDSGSVTPPAATDPTNRADGPATGETRPADRPAPANETPVAAAVDGELAKIQELIDKAASLRSWRDASRELSRLWPGGMPPLRKSDCVRRYQARNGWMCVRAAGPGTLLAPIVQKINLPMILEFQRGDGQSPVYAVLAGVRSGIAELRLGQTVLKLPVDALNTFWRGAINAAMPVFKGHTRPLLPGDTGEDVRQFRHHLAQVHRARSGGVASDDLPTSSHPDRFDEGLVDQVKQFQESMGLSVDGVAGALTMMLLWRQLPAEGMPTLQGP